MTEAQITAAISQALQAWLSSIDARLARLEDRDRRQHEAFNGRLLDLDARLEQMEAAAQPKPTRMAGLDIRIWVGIAIVLAIALALVALADPKGLGELLAAWRGGAG